MKLELYIEPKTEQAVEVEYWNAPSAIVEQSTIKVGDKVRIIFGAYGNLPGKDTYIPDVGRVGTVLRVYEADNASFTGCITGCELDIGRVTYPNSRHWFIDCVELVETR